MKLVIDDKIPYIRGVFESCADVLYRHGAAFSVGDVADADALIVRTRTEVGPALLEQSTVKLVVTATVGVDHLDTRWLAERGIEWRSCPGCNAESVAQYMTAAFLHLSAWSGRSLRELVLGVVGAGHVGNKVIAKALALGMTVLVNDPPREAEEGPGQFSSLETLRHEADFISFHVPLHREGPYRSVHLADGVFLAGMKATAVLFNTSRGAVVDNVALRDALRRRDIGGAVLDVWEGEPDIDQDLLALTHIATPHIAGYSADGKALGTAMSVQHVSRFFGLGLDEWHSDELSRPGAMHIDLGGRAAGGFSDAVVYTYDIVSDDRCLRENPRGFEDQRGRHPVRREFGAYTVSADETALLDTLSALGFKS